MIFNGLYSYETRCSKIWHALRQILNLNISNCVTFVINSYYIITLWFWRHPSSKLICHSVYFNKNECDMLWHIRVNGKWSGIATRCLRTCLSWWNSWVCRDYVWHPRKLQLLPISRFCVTQGLEIVSLIFFCTRMPYEHFLMSWMCFHLSRFSSKKQQLPLINGVCCTQCVFPRWSPFHQ